MDNKSPFVVPTNHVAQYFRGLGDQSARYASWDHCFNYFRKAHNEGRLASLTCGEELQTSCMYLGFYLASWGMYRGSTQLLQNSAQALEPVIREIAETPSAIWTVDVENYDGDSIKQLLETAARLRKALPGNSTDTLVTKTMLGIFGNVPAFDAYFRKGFHTYRLNQKSLEKIKKYFDQYQSELQGLRRNTIDFEGNPTDLWYTQAKIIDMVFFVVGGGMDDV